MYFRDYGSRSLREDFHGFTPAEMQAIIYEPLADTCPISFATDISAELLESSPLYLLARDLLRRMDRENGLKVTARGNLQQRVIWDLYEKRYLPEALIDCRRSVKLRTELDWMPLHTVKVVLKLSRMVRQYRGKLRLTQYGSGILHDPSPARFFLEFLRVCVREFNWAYNDGYEHPWAGQFGFLYLIYLLREYGDQWRDLAFYTDHYYRLLPRMRPDLIHRGSGVPDYSRDVIRTRFFERFAGWFGLAEFQRIGEFVPWKIARIRSTPLMAALLLVTRHPDGATIYSLDTLQDQQEARMRPIKEVFTQFLDEEEARLKPRTFQGYRSAMEQLESSLNGYAYQNLSEEERQQFDLASDLGRQYCEVFAMDRVEPGDFSEFLGYYMIHRVMGRPEEMKTVCRVMGRLNRWLMEREYFDADIGAEIADLVKYYRDVLPDASRLGELISDFAHEQPYVDMNDCTEFLEDMFWVDRVEPGILYLVDALGSDPEPIALKVPEEISALCREGWQINLELGKTPPGWRILASGCVYS